MGFFEKIFKKNNESKPTIASQQSLSPCKTEQELIERYGGIALEKQFNFADYIGNNPWNINTGTGEISFGTELVFPVQILGTLSHSSQTWLWAWANTQSNLPEKVVQQAVQLKKYGEENKIDLLTNDTFDFTKEDLHLIGIIASGIHDSSGYYICDYGAGTMVVTIQSDQINQIHKKDNHQRILTVFPQLISLFDMNHRAALTNYLLAKGYTVSEEATKLEATKNGQTLTAEFDKLSRLTKLNG